MTEILSGQKAVENLKEDNEAYEKGHENGRKQR